MEPTCHYCVDINELEKEYPDEPHHGASLVCDECNAEYYMEYGGKVWAANEEALKSHPELKKF